MRCVMLPKFNLVEGSWCFQWLAQGTDDDHFDWWGEGRVG